MGGKIEGIFSCYYEVLIAFLFLFLNPQTKDEEIESMRSEVTKTKSELAGIQQLLTEKEKSLTENEKNLEQANKTASAARELRRELQFVKVITLSFEIDAFLN